MAVPFVEANSVMVTAPESVLDNCEAMVKRIDRKPRQVYIEARFVELKNRAAYDLGIDWSGIGKLGITASGGAGVSRQRIPNNISEYSQATSTGMRGTSQTYKFTKGGTADNSYFQGMLSLDEMKIILAAFQGSEDVKTFSNPKVIVTSGREAVVDMTTKRPNVILSAKRVLNGNNNTLDVDTQMKEVPGNDNLMFANQSFFSWGVMLSVQPRIMTNELINVSIVPTVSSLGSGGDEYNYVQVESSESDEIPAPKFPIIDVQRIVTEFTLKDGQTAVIGGLSKTYEYDYDNGIPYLCDIPWIGNKLFGGKTRKKEQREIIIFVTVGLADPEDIKNETGLPKNAVLGRTYTNGTRLEPGDRTNAVEGVMSLDLRDLEDRAKETKLE
jgi:general secretion pathway protein D